MIEMQWKDCADTAERIDTNAFDRFPEEHKWGMRLLGESIMSHFWESISLNPKICYNQEDTLVLNTGKIRKKGF